MGDMADYFMDSMFCDDSWRFSYRKSKPIKCKYCNSKDVYWLYDDDFASWRLHDKSSDEPHVCEQYKTMNKTYLGEGI